MVNYVASVVARVHRTDRQWHITPNPDYKAITPLGCMVAKLTVNNLNWHARSISWREMC
jgi:hypothetical protein